MTKEELEVRVLRCIAKKQEGASWDFKRQWHDIEKGKADLLHDIICMSNLLGDEDGLIIIGVDEKNDYSLVDVEEDKNRRNTHDIVKFLRDKHFAGGIRPTAYVETIMIEDIHLDVIVIENSINVPFYLSEHFQDVRDNHIYTRIGDSNTPKDKSADYDKVVMLWKKHLGIDRPTIERFRQYLQDFSHWETTDGERTWFYAFAPEFKIETELDEDSDAYNYYCFTQINSHPRYYHLRLLYYSTVLVDTMAIVLDGGRFMTAIPRVHMFGTTPYYYYATDDISYSLYRFYEFRSSGGRFEHYGYVDWSACVPTLGTRDEAEDFFAWLKDKDIPSETLSVIPCIPDWLPNGEEGSECREDYKHAMIINDMHDVYINERLAKNTL